MKTVELVVHCDARKFPVFASMLTAELSSLLLHLPQCFVKVCVCTSPDDYLTLHVCRRFTERFHETDNILCYKRELPDEELFRRAIGRNIAAKESSADAVFHADADYLFGDGCLDAVANLDFSNAAMYFPREAMIHRAHWLGDREIARIIPGELFTPDMTLFELWKPPYAIGGLQIVSGDTARKGYLDATKWTQPVHDATQFLDTKEDKAYRQACGGSKPADIPNLFRCRHSVSAFEPAAKRLAQTADKQ